ncbi:MAG: peptidoglycan-binding protein [Phormidesmis sp.]
MSIAVSSDLKVLIPGSKGPSVRQLQRGLNLRFQQLEASAEAFVLVDGVFGTNTLTSVKYLQCIGGLPVDGRVGDRTWALVTQGAVGLPVLSVGSAGTEVLAVQQVIAKVGIQLPQSSQFDLATAKAVSAYQRRLGLPITGVVGPRTWDRIVRSRLRNLPCIALLPQ